MNKLFSVKRPLIAVKTKHHAIYGSWSPGLAIRAIANFAGEDSENDFKSTLRAKYGEIITRDDIDTLDRERLSAADKETLRKLKISIANKGRKPWNIGKPHNKDTVERIRKGTRQAMFRADVRERWTARWVPKTHTDATKKKLRSIMLQKEMKKVAQKAEWFRVEMGIDLATYKIYTAQLRNAYRRTFNLQWKIHYVDNGQKQETYVEILRKANIHILNVHTHVTEKRRRVKNRAQHESKNKRIRICKTPTRKIKTKKSVTTKKSVQNLDQKKVLSESICHSKQLKWRAALKYEGRLIFIRKIFNNRTILQARDSTIEHINGLYNKVIRLYRKATRLSILIKSRHEDIVTGENKWSISDVTRVLEKAEDILEYTKEQIRIFEDTILHKSEDFGNLFS